MGHSQIELPYPINRKTVEDAYREIMRARAGHSDRYTLAGRRAAAKRDPKLLRALELGSEVLHKMSEEQAGPHGFDVGGIRVKPTEFTMWANAYKAADSGDSRNQGEYEHFYGMGALLAGLV